MKWLRLLAVGVVASLVFCCLGSIARADDIEQVQKYNVNSFYDYAGASSITATLRAIGAHGYLYVDDRYWSYLTPEQKNLFIPALLQLSQQIDEKIYPISVKLWGSEANPGVDGDSHVVIVLQRLIQGSGGYFENIHNYSRKESPRGNAREMIFINAESVLAGNATTLIAHEIQHLISFNQRELAEREGEDVWLNEARSEYNVTATGYSSPYEFSSLQRRVPSFLRSPSDSLTLWPNTATDYAMASVFVHYLAGRFGEGILSETVASPLQGTASLHDWLMTRRGFGFSDVYVDWMIACLLNDGSIGSAYGFAQPELSTLRVRAEALDSLSLSRKRISNASRLQEWQPRWIAIPIESGVVTTEDLGLRISGPENSEMHGAIIVRYSNGIIRITTPVFVRGVARMSIPARNDGFDIQDITVAITHGSLYPIGGRKPMEDTITVIAAVGAIDEALLPISPEKSASTADRFAYVQPTDGDLIRRKGQSDIYVVWGSYRRLLSPAILALYGLQTKEVRDVPDDVFFHYAASVYIRAQGSKKVYSIWADGTKHWFDISARQWEASGRDWNAIFTVNDAEVSVYTLGASITR